MSKFLPTSGFNWIDPKEFEMLSEYQLNIVNLDNIAIGHVKKLVHYIFDNEKYFLHYENKDLN